MHLKFCSDGRCHVNVLTTVKKKLNIKKTIKLERKKLKMKGSEYERTDVY